MTKQAIAVVIVALIGCVLQAQATNAFPKMKINMERIVANAVMQNQNQGEVAPEQQAEVADQQLGLLIEKYPQYTEQLRKIRILHNGLVRNLVFDAAHRHDQLTTENSVSSVRAIAKVFQTPWESDGQSLQEQEARTSCIQALDHLYKYGNKYAGLGYLAPEVSTWAESHAWNSDFYSHFEEWGNFYNSFSKEQIKIK